ncbi:MAG: hypothetical protein FWD66_06045, partial [Paludibacter sp.]|nr:hypothetical protein [Paludibacter sp.]
LHYICVHLKNEFPKALSYNRFVQIEHRVFIPMMFFLNTVCFGKCTGITFIDSTKIAVCHNKRIYRNNVEHSRHRSIHNFIIMNLIAALGAYCFFDKNPPSRSILNLNTGNYLYFN